jgi:hypothetical protein
VTRYSPDLRIGIIGTGWVGAPVAISVLHDGTARELLLHDTRTDVGEGEAMDLRERLYRVSASDRCVSGIGEPKMADLPSAHQVLDCAGDVLDRHLRIDAVLVEKIDVVRPEAAELALDDPDDVVGATVQTSALLGGRIDLKSELRCDDGPITEGRQRLADDLLAVERLSPGGWGAPDEVASAAAYLLGPESSFMTGSDLLIDGSVIAALRSGRLTLPG